MIYKNVASQGMYVLAYDKTTGVGKTGDAANITATISKDGAAAAGTATANPTEIGAGVYWWPLSQAETNCNALALIPVSATSNILVQPVLAQTEHGAVPSAGVAPALATTDIQSRLPAALVAGRIDSSVGAVANNALTAAALAADAVTEIQSGLSTLDAAGIRTAVGLAAANLDTQLSGINAKTTNLPADPADASVVAAAIAAIPAAPSANDIADAILKRDWTAVSGEAARSVLNALRAIRNKVSRSGATVTVTKEDDSTAAWTAAITTDSTAEPITGVDPS